MLYLHWQPGEKANSTKKDLALDLVHFFYPLYFQRSLYLWRAVHYQMKPAANHFQLSLEILREIPSL